MTNIDYIVGFPYFIEKHVNLEVTNNINLNISYYSFATLNEFLFNAYIIILKSTEKWHSMKKVKDVYT